MAAVKTCQIIDLSGKKFGKLLVVSLNSKIKKDTTWNCICDCGNNCIKRGSNLRQKGTTSCGCFGLETRRIGKGVSGFNRLYKSYIQGAIDRNLSFELTVKEFQSLTSKNCHYCGIDPRQSVSVNNKRLSDEGKIYSRYLFNGIDRKNNNAGYTLHNCIPCCKICNRAKSSMNYSDFIDYINRIKRSKQWLS